MDVEELIERARAKRRRKLDLSGQRVTSLPDALWELTALEVLDLSVNELTALPEAIRRLVNLNSLSINNNYLTQLPPEIGQLANLSSLSINSNRLTQLPPEIGQLANLSSLSINSNRLTQLPSEIGQLANLSSLSINSNRLTQLPSEIGQLANLSSLSLRNNYLTQLPSDIGQLANLSTLVLYNNHLTQLPPKIGQLANLSSLSLRNNYLTQLPSEIGQLANLSTLVLYNNHLTQIPHEVRCLANLSMLDLSFNQLSALPPEIGQLAHLSTLDLSFNQLSALPPEIGQLTNLSTLDFRGNCLAQLPPEITALTNLTSLDLDGNQFPPIPPEIIGKTSKPVVLLNLYIEYLAGQKRALNEAKLLVVGQSSVGKTSLVNRLVHDSFNPQENKTEGIVIQSWQVEDIQLNVWDFGGQEIMHATHQFFLTKRSLYLLVLDSRSNEEGNQLEYWLKIIQSFGGGSPVIVVGNKIDQHRLELDRRGLQFKYSIIKAFVETSCQSGEGIDVLKAVITQEVNKLEHVKDELPLGWFDLKKQLEDMDRDYIPYPDYVNLCQGKGIDNEQSQQTLIGFLHDLGVVLNFRDDPRLEDTNILNPVWATDGVYQILNDNALMTEHKGILKRSMLSRILKSKRYPKSKQLFIIDMMRKFELCFDLVPDKQFLIPDLISKEEPDTGTWDNALAFQYHYNVLPGSIISRFIVRTHTLLSKKTYWRSGAVLTHEGSRALVKADREDKKIFIWVTGSEGTRRQLLGIIRSNFDHIHSTITGIEVAGKVPLPGHPDVVLDYQNLLVLEVVGEIEPFIPEVRDRVNIKQLLEGIGRMESHPAPITKIEHNYYAPVGVASNRGKVDTAAGTVEGDQIGTQNNAPSEQLSKEDILDLLTQVKTLIAAADIPGEVKIAANANLQVAQKATEQETPKKEIALATLESMAETLKEASKSVEAGKTLWNQVSPIAVKVARWLGAAAGSLLMGL